MSQRYIEDLAWELRRDVVKMTAHAGSGHLGGCLSSADLLATLFGREWVKKEGERYLFVLSPGHLAPLLYAVMARLGTGFLSELLTLRNFRSALQGHPVLSHNQDIFSLEGLFSGSGSLGQGLSIAAGAAKAIARQHRQDPPTFYVLLGDGELQEGQVWEAAMFAAHHGLKNLVAVVDWNGQQLDGTNADVMDLGDLPAKWRAFGWDVAEVNGHDCVAIEAALRGFAEANKPKVLLAHTVMGHGIPEIENQSLWHGKAPSATERERFLQALTTSHHALKPQLPIANGLEKQVIFTEI